MKTQPSLKCPSCDAPLLADVTRNAVVTTDGEEVPFRRHTDHVMCSCLASYRVSDLRVVIAQVEARMRSYTAS
jgi:hypothetical protein